MFLIPFLTACFPLTKRKQEIATLTLVTFLQMLTFKLKSFQAQQCGLVEPVINGVITPLNSLINEYLVTYNPFSTVWQMAKNPAVFSCASELLPLGRWKHCFPLLRSPCGDRTSTTPRFERMMCQQDPGVWERFIWWIWIYIYIYIDYDIC